MKKNIALITGGSSSEYTISIKSAETVAAHIDTNKYNLFVISVIRDKWIVTSETYKGLSINKNDFSFEFQSDKIKFDLVVFALHGTPAEDGKLQAYFDMLEIPYVGCDVLCSSLTFNKYACNVFLEKYNIPMAKSFFLRDKKNFSTEAILEKLSLPLFVKPNNAGSSFGAGKVKKASELDEAVTKAFSEDKEVLVEEFISGTEITCGLVKLNNEIIAFPLTEIVYDREFFDTEIKYNGNLVQEITPARISDELTLKCQNLSKDIYKILNAKGLVRVDYILKNDEFYFLELNAIPGMTSESLVPKQIKASAFTMNEIFEKLIQEALK